MMLQHRSRNHPNPSSPVHGNSSSFSSTTIHEISNGNSNSSSSPILSSARDRVPSISLTNQILLDEAGATAASTSASSSSTSLNDSSRKSSTSSNTLVDEKGHLLLMHMKTDEDGEDREKGFHIPYINFYLLSEREADYLLAISTPLYVKLLFICTNLPYFIMGFGVLAQKQVKEHAYPEFLAGVCSFPLTYFIFAIMIATTSTILHSSQMRMGNVCCRRKYAELFHRRTNQDIFDVADCTCATLAVVAVISCQYNSNIFNMMILIVPLFFASILAKKLQLWNLYVITHGLWHLGTAAILWDVVMPDLESLAW